jgi:plasmid stabilization system protein ParE
LNPLAAPLSPELGKEIRKVIFGRYLIIYTIQDDYVRIVRILHGARDIQSLFEQD